MRRLARASLEHIRVCCVGHAAVIAREPRYELAGTSRATVNHVLNEEQRRGSLELRRGRTLVHDPDVLTRWAR
jgi:CRP-like cAMP-binding protein